MSVPCSADLGDTCNGLDADSLAGSGHRFTTGCRVFPMTSIPISKRLAVLLVLVLVLATASAVADPLDDLSSTDPRAVAAAVDAIEHAPPDPDALFAAGRACEDRLLDPARALALYERILAETPDARVASSAEVRAEHLRAQIGPHGEHAAEATAFATLVDAADRSPREQVIATADALGAAAWPGAPDAELWVAEWLRRHGDCKTAAARYTAVVERWPQSSQARLARRGGAGCALDIHAWDRAEELARALPGDSEDDRDVRAGLLTAAARGRFHERLYLAAWLGLALAVLALLASLAEATLRGGRRWPAARPPIEVLFLAPVAAVIVAVSFTAHRAIAPAVLRISLIGLALAWLSGSALDLLRARSRPVRMRALAHVAACAIGVVAIGYIAITRDGLLELLVETVRFGPD